MDTNTRSLFRLIIFLIIGTDRAILGVPILITHGGFQKSLLIVQEQILQELIDWERGFNGKLFQSEIYF
jgi:hypothetical protein